MPTALILEPGSPTTMCARSRKPAGIIKAGFGAFASPYDYVPLIESARRARHDLDGAYRRRVDARLVRHLGRAPRRDAASTFPFM